MNRVFNERQMIEHLLQKSLYDYQPTGDELIDQQIEEHLMEEVPRMADNFVQSLYAITRNMCFSEWNDFWFDMGIRVFDAENEFNDYELDESMDDEDDYEFNEL